MTDSPMAPDNSVQGGDSPGLIPPVIGSLLLLLPLATAVQAWLADAPGKGWASILAVAALAIGVAGWWLYRGLLFLSGLLAAAALIVSIVYLYGSESAALSIAGVPLRLFVPGLLLATLALAAWELARLPKLPLWARFIAPSLAIFAAVPVVMGLIEGVPFVEVLVGLWTLPYWTQGAWFGAAILLPLALIVAVLRVAIPAWRDEPFRTAVALTAIIALLTASLATGFTMTSRDLINLTAFVPVPGREVAVASVKPRPPVAIEPGAAQPDSASTAAAPEPVANEPSQAPSATAANSEFLQSLTPSPEEAAAIEAELNRAFDAIEEVLPNIPRDTFDVQAVVDQVGKNPDQLLGWVRDNTAWLPYEGALRGPKGVLLDRAGNSLDRALLLSAMLEAAGYETRLKRAELPSDVAEALVRDAQDQVPPDSRDDDYDLLADLLLRLEAKGSPRVAELRQSAADFRRERQELIDTARDRADRQAKRLLSMIDVPTDQEEKLHAQTVKAASDHWWVEGRIESAWKAFDPAATPAHPDPGVAGKSRGSFQADRLPANVLHTVTVRVIIEQLRGKSLREKIALEHEIIPANEPVVQLGLSHAPEDWPEELTPLAMLEQPDSMRTFIKIAGEQTKWIPVLRVGNQRIVDKGFSDKGDLYTPGGAAADAGNSTRTFGGLAGGLSGGGSSSENLLTAEWVEFEVRSPSVPTDKVRRAVFDLLGPDGRTNKAVVTKLSDEAHQNRALTLIGATELSIQSARATNEYADNQTLTALISSRHKWVMALTNPTGLINVDNQIDDSVSLPQLGPTIELALARSSIAPSTSFYRQPNITAFWQRPKTSVDRGLGVLVGLDIVRNSSGLAHGRKMDFASRMLYGVSDTVLEAKLLGETSETLNTSRLFDDIEKDNWKTVSPLHRQSLMSIDISPDIYQKLDTDLQNGFLVVFPINVTTERFSWWRIHPVTGETVGIGPMGWGQVSTEYAVKQAKDIMNMITVTGCVVLSVQSGGRAKPGDADAPWWTVGRIAGCLAAGAITSFAIQTGRFSFQVAAWSLQTLVVGARISANR